jgi:hypothetical protein
MATELRDLGSEARHYQLLAVCEENDMGDLATAALAATRRRLDNPRREPVERPGAYYQDILLTKLAERGIHIPTKTELEQDAPDDVRQLIQESLAAGSGPGDAPAEGTP